MLNCIKAVRNGLREQYLEAAGQNAEPNEVPDVSSPDSVVGSGENSDSSGGGVEEK
jgi:hypothetical protein